MVRQRSATPLSPVQIWVAPPKKNGIPLGMPFFFSLAVSSDLNCALHAYGVAESGSHTPLGDRQACLSGVERGYLRLWRIPGWHGIPLGMPFFFSLAVSSDLNCALHAYGVAESGSHTPLGDRQACLSGVERGYLRLWRIPGWHGIPLGMPFFLFFGGVVRFELRSARLRRSRIKYCHSGLIHKFRPAVTTEYSSSPRRARFRKRNAQPRSKIDKLACQA